MVGRLRGLLAAMLISIIYCQSPKKPTGASAEVSAFDNAPMGA
jgi:hypothetical protein